jgi:quercetin dioxygenase-like cupin family protein
MIRKWELYNGTNFSVYQSFGSISIITSLSEESNPGYSRRLSAKSIPQKMSTPTAKLIKSGDIWQIEGYYAYRNRVRRRESTNMISRPRENFRVLNVFHPPNIPGKSMVVGVIDMDPNGATPSHTHGGAAVVAMVASGTVLNQMNCEEPIVSKAGDIWYEAPGCHHVRSENAGGGSETARFFAVLIVDDEVIRDGVHNIFVLDIEKAEKESAQ